MKRSLAALAVLTALGAAYARRLREPILTWGATAEEAAARLPGDELLEDADGVATRAITIDAPASAVWPWLAQMGPSPRGGAYTYDWIENLLRLDMHSVDRVLPEFQHPRLGEGWASARTRCATPSSIPSTCSRCAPGTATGSGASSSGKRTVTPG
jgi:hypothetical protein